MRTRVRPRRRPRRRTAAFSPPPFSSLLPPFRGEVGRGVPRLPACRRRRVIPPGPPSRGEKRVRGGRGAGAVGRPPVRSAEPGAFPLPTSPLPGGRSATGRTRVRPRRRTGRRTAAAFSPPPFFRGEVGRGVRRRRAGGRRRVIPPTPLPGGRREGGAAGVRGRSGGPPSGLRSRGDARSPPTPAQEADRRLLSSSFLFSPPPFQGGGREGGLAAARGWAVAGHPPRPLPGGRREGGGCGGGREALRPVCGASDIPPPGLPPSRGEERRREDARTAPTPDQAAARAPCPATAMSDRRRKISRCDRPGRGARCAAAASTGLRGPCRGRGRSCGGARAGCGRAGPAAFRRSARGPPRPGSGSSS